ncbi:MAG: aspartate-semialdehyde dehydrogenase [Pseudomonadota bacterium]
MQVRQFNVAVCGATGNVGRMMTRVLEERNFPVARLKLLASERSAGKVSIPYRDEDLPVERLTEESFKGCDLALFSAGGGVSRTFAPAAWRQGCVVVDNSSAWRMDSDVPLVVPECNPEDIALYKTKGIIANPNCSTIQMVVALKPIHDAVGIRRIVVSTYQSVSGTGWKAIVELEEQSRALMSGGGSAGVTCNVYPHRIAFNCLPHIDVFLENGYTKEEMKMVNETRKILHDQTIGVSATTVRVPVFRSHSESVNIETRKKITPEEVRQLLSSAPGVRVVDDPGANVYPLATEAAGHDETLVGRIRADESVENGINMWIVADNIRKGAATNAVQIAEILAERYI